MISKFKGMWTKAKRLLDKEIQCYRENSCKESKELNSPTKHIESKSNLIKAEENTYTDLESIDADNTVNTKGLVLNPIEESISIINPSVESESMDNPGILHENAMHRNPFQVVASTTNSNTMDIHDGTRDFINIDTSNINIKSAEAFEAPLKVILVHKPISYNIRIQSLENYSQSITVTFVVEIPDFTKADCGRWVLSFRCVINEYSNLDCFVLNASGIYIDKVDHEVNAVLQETVQCTLKLIQLNKNCILMDQNYVFYPKEENVVLSDLCPGVLASVRNEASVSVGATVSRLRTLVAMGLGSDAGMVSLVVATARLGGGGLVGTIGMKEGDQLTVVMNERILIADRTTDNVIEYIARMDHTIRHIKEELSRKCDIGTTSKGEQVT